MGFAEGSGLLFLAGMSHGVRFFGPPYWKIDPGGQPRSEESVLRGVRKTTNRPERGGSDRLLTRMVSY